MNKKKITIISTIVIIGVGALSYTAYAQYQKKSKINTFKTDLESFQKETKNSIMSKDENSEVNSLISECNKIVDTSNINAIPEMENKLNSELNEIKKENETLIKNQIKEVSSLNTSKLSDKDDITKKLNDIKSLESKGEFATANQELIKLKEHINSENESMEKKEQEEAKKKVEEEKKKQESQLKENLSTPEKIILYALNNKYFDHSILNNITPVKTETGKIQLEDGTTIHCMKAVIDKNSKDTFVVSQDPFSDKFNTDLEKRYFPNSDDTKDDPNAFIIDLEKTSDGNYKLYGQPYVYFFDVATGSRFEITIYPDGSEYASIPKQDPPFKIR